MTERNDLSGAAVQLEGDFRTKHDEPAVAAVARAIRRAWPARSLDKAASGWASVVLVALRADPDGGAAVVAALLDEETLARALETSGALNGSVAVVHRLSRDILTALAGSIEDEA